MTTPATDYLSEVDRYSAHNYHPLPLVLERGDGAWVWDVDGKKYLDCLAAYSAVNQGHCHPKIIQALVEQAGKVTLTSRAFRNDQLGPFMHELCELTGFEMGLPMNSGAEGVETALKLARKWAYAVKGVPRYEAEIITVAGNFHGRTITVISFSSDWLYPPYQAKELVRAMKVNNLDVSEILIKTDYGHDSFLVEVGNLEKLVSHYLNKQAKDYAHA